ncbi:TetR/AcrR family transcriptional regulator [uncultured Microbacterium sp.]|uniref:TetR/AcrR family transcriptional regulator n=1 Tax=uncultured Microbacterium sp. TaxID=191216 RepID=UPI0025D876DF|nr:TetR/AcrR family transcriptional regulator [uncultured Microbacterium sp.]
MAATPERTPSTAPATGRRARGEATRARLIASARALLAGDEQGTFTTRNVAALAGVTHGMCHYHFRDRTELVLAIIEDVHPEWITPLREAVDHPGSFRERADLVLELLTEPESASSARLFSALHGLALSDDRVREGLAAEYREWTAAFVDLFLVLRQERPDRRIDAEARGWAAAAAADGLAAYAALGLSDDPGAALRSLLSEDADGDDTR